VFLWLIIEVNGDWSQFNGARLDDHLYGGRQLLWPLTGCGGTWWTIPATWQGYFIVGGQTGAYTWKCPAWSMDALCHWPAL